MSVRALALANVASERDGGNQSFRIQAGYAALVRWLMNQAIESGAQLRFDTIATHVRWERGAVEIRARTPAGECVFHSKCAVTTVPLGVLQSDSGIRFEPEPPGTMEAIGNLEMGRVVRVTMEFRERFWPEPNFGFVHSSETPLPTWWSDERGTMLTGWAGGPRARALARDGVEALRQEAIYSLSRIFKTEAGRVDHLTSGFHYHDWSRDPFSLGAYSFTPVNQMDMPAKLGEPVSGTLFFAGEATDTRGEQGTVHAALASGERAARDVLTQSCPK